MPEWPKKIKSLRLYGIASRAIGSGLRRFESCSPHRFIKLYISIISMFWKNNEPAKLELEERLEKGLEELGISFSERYYNVDWKTPPKERTEYPCTIFERIASNENFLLSYLLVPTPDKPHVKNGPKYLVNQNKVDGEIIQIITDELPLASVYIERGKGFNPPKVLCKLELDRLQMAQDYIKKVGLISFAFLINVPRIYNCDKIYEAVMSFFNNPAKIEKVLH